MSAISAGAALAQVAGGKVVVAQTSNPPSLDAMATSSAQSRNVTMNVYETLYGFDENVVPIPILAEGVDISADGLTYTFKLRQGVKFHNGDEMKASDVLASMERYRKVGATGNLLKAVESFEVTGDYEIVFHMVSKTPTFLESFSSPRAPAVIIPEEDANAEAGKTSLVGTGPYKIVEYVPDVHVVLEKFADYTQDTRHEGPDGFGGKKTAYFDQVEFRIMPEPGAQVAALEAGEVDILDAMPVAAARRLANDPNIKLYEGTNWAFATLILNTNEAPTDNVKFREAVQVALNMEEIVGIATEGLFTLNGGWAYPDTPYDVGDIGAKDYYNKHDVERAKALLKEAGYNNEPFSILTDPASAVHSKSAVVIAEQLKAVGINAVINQVDWPTALKIRMEDTGWQGWTLSMGIEPYLGPAAIVATLAGTRPHFVKPDPVLEDLYLELIAGETTEARKATFAKIQQQLYTNFGIIKLGDTRNMQASRANIEGFKAFRFPRVYDIWRAK
ncbi:MAG TPA: ABC transporter substrate-binding protein [Devosia sp.]|nr:ABC transporter substrate-binding protein [Devosia sp.]